MNASIDKAPKPLTAPPAPDLDWSREGTPASGSYDDIYFSVDGGLEETKTVFLKACGLPQHWQDADVFTVFELGFGSGLNFLAAWDLWLQTAKPSQRLHFVSIEAFPWSRDDLAKALAFWPSLKPLADKLVGAWPGRVKGTHRLHLGNVSLTLLHDEAETALANFDGRVDAWFLDGFSPSKNPDMWSTSVFTHMARLSNNGAMVGTFTVSGLVRRGLTDAGFDVCKKPGFGRKRERLEAVYKCAPQEASKKISKTINAPVIIGGGIAGASIAHAFLRRGIKPILIDPHRDLNTAASGNPAGLVMPRLDLQDRPESRFFLAAYLYALQFYKNHGTVLSKGVLHMVSRAKEAERFAKIITNQALPIDEMQWVSAAKAEGLFGSALAPNTGGLYFPNALIVSPIKSVLSLTEKCSHVSVRAHSFKRGDNIWRVYDEGGNMLAQTCNLFVCNGANVLDLILADVRFTSGQICWGEHKHKPKTGIIAGNYAVPFNGGVLLGASHAHVGAGENNDTNPESSENILGEYAGLTGQAIADKNWQSRAAVRVTTKDTLPLAYEVETGLFLMSGLGSRGLMMAPLLGEALVCAALKEPLPIDRQTRLRFTEREKTKA